MLAGHPAAVGDPFGYAFVHERTQPGGAAQPVPDGRRSHPRAVVQLRRVAGTTRTAAASDHGGTARPRTPSRSAVAGVRTAKSRGRSRSRIGPRCPPPTCGRLPCSSTAQPRWPSCRPNHVPEGPSVLRTHEAGTLRADHAGQTVTLTGWVARRRDHGGVAFLDLRDASGVAQVVARDEVLAQGGAHDVRNEFCVKVTGEVRTAPRATPTPTCPPARSRSSSATSRSSTPRRRCPSRSTSGSPSARRHASSTATSTCVAPARARPVPRSACAPRSTPPREPSSAHATSSRSRRRR